MIERIAIRNFKSLREVDLSLGRLNLLKCARYSGRSSAKRAHSQTLGSGDHARRRPAAKVEVLTRPRLRGYADAITAIRNELPRQYGFKDLWLFFPDADTARDDAMRNLEAHVTVANVTLLCCAARPELEIYACAAHRDELAEGWEEIRVHPRLKEEIFEPLLAKRGDARRPGAGRDLFIGESLKNLPSLFRLCPELRQLRDRIATHLEVG